MCAIDLLASRTKSILLEVLLTYPAERNPQKLMGHVNEILSFECGEKCSATARGKAAILAVCEDFVEELKNPADEAGEGQTTCNKDCSNCNVAYAMCGSLSPVSMTSLNA